MTLKTNNNLGLCVKKMHIGLCSVFVGISFFVAYGITVTHTSNIDLIAQSEAKSFLYSNRHSFLISSTDRNIWQQYRKKRSNILDSTITLILPEETHDAVRKSDGTIPTWRIALADHQSWMSIQRNGFDLNPSISPEKLAEYISASIEPVLPKATHITITEILDTSPVRVITTGTAQDGWILDAKVAAQSIVHDFQRGKTDFVLPIEKEVGSVINSTTAPGTFELLSEGRSNFAGSTTNRKYNIQKAINDKLNGILILPGETFSFNSILGPVTIANGWRDALTIFDGGAEARPAPGGGLCQVSTTVYRSALLAGLPILERANHSWYLSYYFKYGEGLDATIFPGKQDLVFTNDTPGSIIILPEIIENDLYVRFFGTLDNRIVTMEGPFRFHNAPEDFPTKDPLGIRKSEIVWRRTVEKENTKTVDNIISRYQGPVYVNAPENAGINNSSPSNEPTVHTDRLQQEQEG